MSTEPQPAAPLPDRATNPAPAARLNILALPTRTTLLFALILLVVALPILALFAGRSPMCAPFLLLWMILLPLRDFLRRPSVLLREHDAADPASECPTLARQWNELASTWLHRVVRLKLARRKPVAPFSFGSFTRRYCALSVATARRLESDLRSIYPSKIKRAQALLLHELAHFIHRDVWMAFFASSLLRVTILFMLLDYAWYALAPWMYNSIVSVVDFGRVWSPEFLQLMAGSNPQMAETLVHPPPIAGRVLMDWEVLVFSVHWPLVLGSAVLWLFYWPALLRTRELYADASVVEKQRGDQYLWEMLRTEHVASRLQLAFRPRKKSWATKIASHLPRPKWPRIDKIRGWLFHHPSLRTRRICLNEPHLVYGDDTTIGATAGITVVLLNLTLATSYLLLETRGPNSQVPLLIGFGVLALSLLPSLCQFPQRQNEYAAKIKKVVLIFTAIKLVPQYLVGLGFAAALLLDPALLDQAAYTLVLGAGPNPPPTGVPVEYAVEIFVIRPALFFTFVMPPLLVLWLHLDAWIKRRILRWYGAGWVRNQPAWILGGVTFFLMVPLAFIVLPILDAVTIPTAHDLSDPATVVGLSAALVICLGSAIAFHFGHRRYADRCPFCNERIADEYFLGKTCPACCGLLHPRLVRQDSPTSSLPTISLIPSQIK